MTYYAGLDISMKQTSIAIVDERGNFVRETICQTEPELIAETLQATGLSLEKVGLEAGSLSFWLVEELKSLGIHTICIESKEMATLIALKVNKTDRNDARQIANAMRCNLYKEVYNKKRESIEVGLQMKARRTLINIRTQLKNTVRGLLKAYGIRLGAVSHQKFPGAVRDAITSCDTASQEAIERILKSYVEVCKNAEEADLALDSICQSDPVIQLFESIPGVGPITAVTFKAVIDNPHRFTNVRNIGAYLGLTPRQYSSGDTVRQGGISRCGCTELRMLLVECGLLILTKSARWTKLKAWGLKIMKRSGVKKAAAAVARKLAIIMLRMWQTGNGFIWGEKQEHNDKKLCAV